MQGDDKAFTPASALGFNSALRTATGIFLYGNRTTPTSARCRRRGVFVGYGMWRRVLSAAAWAVMVIVSGPSSGPIPAAPSWSGHEVEKAAQRLDALMVAILGNVEELRASERLNYHRVEGGT